MATPGTVSATTPQGLHSHLFGYSATSDASADAFFGNYASSNVTSSLLFNLGPNAVAIGGRQFIVDTSADPYRRDSFKHKSIPAQRQSINLTNIAGEGTINTEGLWRRGQANWTSGAGQKYLDRKTTSDDSRFYQSKGVDVFASPGQVTLQNATKSIRTSVNTNLKVSRCDSYTYIIDGTSVYECADITAATPTWTAMTFNSGAGHAAPTAFYSIDSNGSFVFVATNTGIWYYRAGGSGGTVRRFECYAENDTNTQFTGYNLVRWCNDRVVAASGIQLYCFATTHVTWPNAGNAPGSNDNLYAMTNNLAWTWSDACSGPSAIYFAGYSQTGSSGYNGGVFKSGITVSGTTVTVAVPTQALPMSPDEYPTCLQGYLDYIFIGTNRGIRMTQPDSQGGLTSGPYSPSITQPVTYPVRSITGDGRFVWFGWSNYDNSSTGLGRLDLTNNIANQALTPAYQSDLMVSGGGETLDLSWDPSLGQPIFTVSGKGFYTTDTSKYVDQGYIKSGGITYGIPDHKTPVFFDYGVDMPDNTPVGASEGFVSAELEVEPFDPSQKQTLSIPSASEGRSQVTISSGSTYKSEMFQVTVYINSDSTNVTTPILYRYTLQSYPATVSETQIVVPVQLHLVNVVDGLETYADPYEAFMYFEELRQSNTIITYQESTLTANVVITQLDWQPHKRQGNYESGFEGNCIVYLTTVGGYNTYPGIPTN